MVIHDDGLTGMILTLPQTRQQKKEKKNQEKLNMKQSQDSVEFCFMFISFLGNSIKIHVSVC